MRMNKLLYTLLILVASSTHLLAQGGTQLRGELSDCKVDSLLFFQLNGNMVEMLGKLPLQSRPEDPSVKTLAVSLPENLPHGFYFVGGGRPENSKLTLFAGDPVIQLQGSCPSLAKGKALSPNNQALDAAMAQNAAFNKESNQLLLSYRRTLAQKKSLQTLDSAFASLDSRRLDYYSQLKDKFPAVSKVLALQTYLSYMGFGKEKAPNEQTYFAGYYFQLADFTDSFHERNPHIQDAFRSYALTLGKMGMPVEDQLTYVNLYLDQLRGVGDKAYKTACLGLIQGFQSSNEDMYLLMGDRYLKDYGHLNPGFTQALEKGMAPVRQRAIGALAPEINLPTYEGDSLLLSSLRGKYVLIDFWASWCGPCRRENPNVRRVYASYKDKGFEILGVSLDRSKDAWIKAIQKDQLGWLHVSDLKGWGSIGAKVYGVHSIPATVLLDPEGKIIAKGLRGNELDQKLARIFAESKTN